MLESFRPLNHNEITYKEYNLNYINQLKSFEVIKVTEDVIAYNPSFKERHVFNPSSHSLKKVSFEISSFKTVSVPVYNLSTRDHICNLNSGPSMLNKKKCINSDISVRYKYSLWVNTPVRLASG